MGNTNVCCPISWDASHGIPIGIPFPWTSLVILELKMLGALRGEFSFSGPYFKLGALWGGMSCKLALHVFFTFTEQVVPIHKHITLFSIPSISGTKTVTMTLLKRQRWSYLTTLLLHTVF